MKSATLLSDALDRVGRETRLLVMTAGAVSLLAVLGLFVFANFRVMLQSYAMPALSDRDVAAVAGVLVFWVVMMACLDHLQSGLRNVFAHRFAHLLSVPALVASAGSSGSRGGAPRTLADVEAVTNAISGPLLGTGLALMMVPAMVVVLTFVHWSFTLLAAVAVLVRLGFALVLERSTKEPFRQVNLAHAEVLGSLGSTLNAAEAAEAMGLVPRLTRRWVGQVEAGAQGMLQLRGRVALLDAISRMLDDVMLVAPVVLMCFLAINDNGVSSITSGITAMLLLGSVVNPLSRLGSLANELATLRNSWERLRDLADQQRQQAQNNGIFLCSAGRLEVDRLTLTLPGMLQPVIHDLSFRLEPGQMLSLAGPVGCGKSSLLRAIIGILPPASGGCYLDGNATFAWDRVDLARYVGYLPQSVGLDSGTVASAIARLGPVDMELVLEAARRAGAHELITRLPRGYSTRLQEMSLSAGQRQRVALARAIYGRPQLVVLDEPGAWLDAEGLEQLRRLLLVLKREGTSVIFSSHEPGLLELADHGISLGPPGTAPRGTSRRKLPAPQRQVPAA